MTREEAIELLKRDKEQRGKYFIDALDMAIKALKQGEVLNEIWLEIEGLKFDHEPNILYEIHNKAIEIVLRIIDRHKEESEGDK